MGRTRTKLPERWAHKHGAYYYRPREHEKPAFDGKAWFRLGKSYPEALRTFAERKEIETGDTLGSVCDRYTIEALPSLKPQTQQSYLRALERIKRGIGPNKIGLIKPQLVYQYMEHIKEEHGMNSANIDLKVMNGVLDHAIRWGLVEGNAIKGNVRYYGKRDGLQKERSRYVEDWELAEWSQVATPVQRAFAALVLLTGARKGEILRIKRSDIKDNHLVIKSSKTGKESMFVITAALRDAIDAALRIHKKPSFWLLPNRSGQCYINDEGASKSFDQGWRRSMKQAIATTKLEQSFTRHDLRAKVGSDADSDERAQQLLGHSNPNMTRKHYRRRIPIITPTR